MVGTGGKSNLSACLVGSMQGAGEENLRSRRKNVGSVLAVERWSSYLPSLGSQKGQHVDLVKAYNLFLVGMSSRSMEYWVLFHGCPVLCIGLGLE